MRPPQCQSGVAALISLNAHVTTTEVAEADLSSDLSCVCNDGFYNASLVEPFMHALRDEGVTNFWSFVTCHSYDEDFLPPDMPGLAPSQDTVCQPCPTECATCTDGIVNVKPGYAPAPIITTMGAPLAASKNGPHRPLFRCTNERISGARERCLGSSLPANATSASKVQWCADEYEGPLCSNCNEEHSIRSASSHTLS